MSAPNTVRTNRGLPITKTIQILSGQSLSAAIDLSNYRLARITLPASWTTADLTFQASADGAAGSPVYNNVYDAAATELTVKAAASREVLVDRSAFESLRWLKIRSGTSGVPVNQGADRDIVLTLVP